MTSLIRFHYDPLIEFDRLFDDAFATRFFSSSIAGRSPADATRPFDAFRPRVDVKESNESNDVTATFELPGLQGEDVTIDLRQNRLTVSGESSTAHAHEEAGYAVRERRVGKFSRTLQLPLGTKPEDVKAKMENGLLTVTFPKTSPEQEPRRIAIQ